MNYQTNYPTQGTQMVTLVDPNVIQTLQGLMGKVLVIETVRGSYRGKLLDLKPDHVVLKIGDTIFFVHIQHIVSIMPD